MLIMKTCLSSKYRKGGLKNVHFVPKSTPREKKTKRLLQSNYRMINITAKISNFSIVARKVTFTIWLKLKKKLGLPVMYSLVDGEFI